MDGNVEKSAEPEPGPNEQYCHSCGDIIKKEAEICPNCGVRISDENEEKSTLGYAGYMAIGITSGLIAFLFVPVVFGPLSVFCGAQIYRKYSELSGILVVLLGGLGLIVGMLIGMIVAAS